MKKSKLELKFQMKRKELKNNNKYNYFTSVQHTL